MEEDKKNKEYLAAAACMGDFNEVKRLLDLNADPSGKPMHMAVRQGNPEIVTTLLKAGADPNKRYLSPFIIVAGLNGHVEVVKILLEAGADVNACDLSGRTALDWAASNGHAEVVRIFLSPYTDKNKCVAKCRIPLLEAAYFGHADVVGVLLSHGARPNLLGEVGITPLIAAISKNTTV